MGEGPFLHADVGVEVDLCGLHGFVAQPQGDDTAIDATTQKGHGGGVAQHVGRDVLCCDRRTLLRGCARVLGDESLDGVATEMSSAGTRKERRRFRGREFSEPGANDAHDVAA